jgi:dTDP-4-dehydrorhamnose 3,5-epimerase
MAFRFERLALPDVILVEARGYKDERGLFMETFKRYEFAEHGIPQVFAQDNYSYSVERVLRGLHYQAQPKAQGKLVMVLRGHIYDVAVDIRPDSPTLGKWVGVELSEENHRMLYIPTGFAHGFCVLGKEACVSYKVTEEYAPELDRGIIWSDPEIAIRWPIAEPILSPKDACLPTLRQVLEEGM